jgi:hypothetical protein
MRSYLLWVSSRHGKMTPLLHSAERLYDIAVHDYGPWTEEDVRKNCEAEYWLPYPGREKFEVAATMVNVLPSYRYYAFLDDDLTIDALTLNKLFLVGDCLDLKLYQPALTQGSYGSHGHLFQSHWESPVRKVPFVEIMCPFMSRRFVEKASPMFDLNISAWGLDMCVWPKLTDDCYVIDSIPVAHLRAPERRDRVQRNGLTPAQEYEIVRKMEYDGNRPW